MVECSLRVTEERTTKPSITICALLIWTTVLLKQWDNECEVAYVTQVLFL